MDITEDSKVKVQNLADLSKASDGAAAPTSRLKHLADVPADRRKPAATVCSSCSREQPCLAHLRRHVAEHRSRKPRSRSSIRVKTAGSCAATRTRSESSTKKSTGWASRSRNGRGTAAAATEHLSRVAAGPQPGLRSAVGRPPRWSAISCTSSVAGSPSTSEPATCRWARSSVTPWKRRAAPWSRGDTEGEVASQLSHRLLHRGAMPVPDQRGGRCPRCRAPPSAAQLHGHAGARELHAARGRWRANTACGAQASRSMCFGQPDSQFRREHDAACKVSATYIAGTWP